MFCALAATWALWLLFTLEENLINSLTDQINIHSNSSSCLENIKALMWHHLVARWSHLHFSIQSPFSFQITLYMTVNDIYENCQIFLKHLWSFAWIRCVYVSSTITATKWNNRILIHADFTNLYLHFTLFFNDTVNYREIFVGSKSWKVHVNVNSRGIFYPFLVLWSFASNLTPTLAWFIPWPAVGGLSFKR